MYNCIHYLFNFNAIILYSCIHPFCWLQHAILFPLSPVQSLQFKKNLFDYLSLSLELSIFKLIFYFQKVMYFDKSSSNFYIKTYGKQPQYFLHFLVLPNLFKMLFVPSFLT